MIQENKNVIAELLQAIETGWSLCDEKDTDDFMVLVNESRTEHPSLKPLKSLVKELEMQGYLSFDEVKSDPKNKSREFMDFLGDKIPIQLVYFFTVTSKGKDLL